MRHVNYFFAKFGIVPSAIILLLFATFEAVLLSAVIQFLIFDIVFEGTLLTAFLVAILVAAPVILFCVYTIKYLEKAKDTLKQTTSELDQRIVELTASNDARDKARAELHEARVLARLHQTQKLEALGTLAGGVAHDFNNVLAIINGYADVLARDLKEEPDLQSFAEEILSAGERGAALVEQILAYSRNEKDKLENTSVSAVLQECDRMLRSTLPANIVMETSISEGDHDIKSDATQLHQVITNLCLNGVHAIGSATGNLRVELRAMTVTNDCAKGLEPLLAASSSDAIVVESLLDGRGGCVWCGRIDPSDYQVLTVQDDGCGMDFVTLQRIFEPFFTTKNVGEGTGLGLATVTGILRSHNAAIVVDTKLNVGTRFDVYLPTSTGVGIASGGSDHTSDQKSDRAADQVPGIPSMRQQVLTGARF
ncbi:MAG: hypothetical protein HOK21_06410 [Rhodospirillaceae bacterium]|jgi:signal transduction histidine kinase|nr:hypothetical protein [Rhodospirillaceae bacterium]MBT5523697.1 hypothetical protein [Rhodospirillaceae bacterium]MBT6589698.1 hypothetical protein [Rhodospirillaceae bacterium]MBT6985128.1 hypothetical protein [Rhodospirillaceae bacterium]